MDAVSLLNNLAGSHKTPNIIYHYCTVESFFNIINSQQIYLSTTKYMNDYKESKHLTARLSNIENQKRTIKNYLIRSVRAVIKGFNREAYVTCFSQHQDLLSQWKFYANDGTGIAIGFDSKFLNPLNNFCNNFILNKIKYEVEEQDRLLLEINKHYYDLDNPIKPMPIEDIHKISFDRLTFLRSENVCLADVLNNNLNFRNPTNLITIKYTQCLLILSYLFKSASFFEEDEYRLCYLPDFKFLSPVENLPLKIKIGDFSYRSHNNKIYTYYPLDFMDQKNIIKEVIIGPKCEVDKSILRSLLKKNGFNNINIFKSKASYR